jgi:F-type H+-transporting ATPase subunit epsilon
MADAEVLSLEIATPVGLALSTECESIAAPSVEGEFGVFPGHLPLLAALRAGVLKYRSGGKDLVAAVGPGFVEAGPSKVLLLTDTFARPEDVDAAEVQEELTRAEERLAALGSEHAAVDHDEIEREIEWAHARLAIAERH